MRLSRVAYVVIRLQVGDADSFLLRMHRKWGDWSLVGGHVEDDELDDWSKTARRESDEELEPLRSGADFTIQELGLGVVAWGPQSSKSAGGAATRYEAQWFALRFTRDPHACLAALVPGEFLLVERELAREDPTRAEVASLLARLDDIFPGGLAAIPLAWPDALDVARVGIALRRVSQAPQARTASA